MEPKKNPVGPRLLWPEVTDSNLSFLGASDLARLQLEILMPHFKRGIADLRRKGFTIRDIAARLGASVGGPHTYKEYGEYTKRKAERPQILDDGDARYPSAAQAPRQVTTGHQTMVSQLACSHT